MKLPSRFSLWLLTLLLLAGCTTVVVPPGGERYAGDEATMQALKALDQGNYDEAIQRFTQLRDQSQPPKRQEYEIYIAQALHKSDRDQQASQLLEPMNMTGVSPHMAMLRQLIRADIALRQDPNKAMSLLTTPAAPESEQSLHADYHLLRARIFIRLNSPISAAREYVAREPFLQSPDDIEANQVAIWQALASVPPEALAKLKLLPPPDIFSGWVELAKLAKDPTLAPEQLQQQLTVWHLHYPQHPIAQHFLDDMLARSEELSKQPTSIAVLLPLSGRFAQAGMAVRDGFLAAHYQTAGHEGLTLRFYDIGTQPEQALNSYNQAVSEGAQFVVGPLDKSAVQILATQSDLPVPVLALNYAGPATNDNIYQFALAPEDEAIEAADRAWADGHSRIGLIVPDDPLGARMADAFSEHWQALGGSIAGKALYDPSKTDNSTAIEDLLNLSDSDARRAHLQQVIGTNLEFTPRRRQDIDALFVVALPMQGRLLRPTLRFHYAGDIPVYTTSLIYSGTPDPAKDRDLDGISFCDAPWILDPPDSQAKERHYIQSQLPPYGGQLQRLVAMGVDAYHLVPLLRMLKLYPYERYQGESGVLRVSNDNRVLRRQQWAKFRQGQPQLLEQQPEEKRAK